MKDLVDGTVKDMPWQKCGTGTRDLGSAERWGISDVVATKTAIAPWGTAKDCVPIDLSPVPTFFCTKSK